MGKNYIIVLTTIGMLTAIISRTSGQEVSELNFDQGVDINDALQNIEVTAPPMELVPSAMPALSGKEESPEGMKLEGMRLDNWQSYIGQCGAEGEMFNPNLPEIKLAKGLLFRAGTESGSRIAGWDFQGFAAFPDVHEKGRARVLICETNCDFFKKIHGEGGRGGCQGYQAYYFEADDEGVLLSAYKVRDGEAVEMGVDDRTTQDLFIKLRKTFTN
ncbi:MAG: hypothetical protein KKH28_13500 [Elusimicrobia bacterium]|nr:hypothetical protein [Elusimicrobiota bacterium]